MEDWSIVVVVLQLIFLEGVLSIDNAAVLGAMASQLPADLPVPWPRSLAWLGNHTERLLGMQREAALKVGLLGAYAGRFLMLLAAAFVVRNPWLRMVGALYLIYLAVEYIAHMDEHHADDAVDAHTGERVMPRHSGFWSTVLVIELADLAFSLDNVVAAITLSDEIWVVMLGVALGIIAMRFAASIFSRLILWEPALQTGAYLLVLSLGVELVLKEIFHLHIGELTQFLLSAGILVATVLVARSPLRNADGLWNGVIQLFKALYFPFGLVVQLLQALVSPFRRHEVNA
jgi:tellurite resistance protein TerC